MSKPLKAILGSEKARLPEDLQDLVAVVEESLDSTVTLRELFTENRIDTLPSLDTAFRVAELAFVIPFLYSDEMIKEELKVFLAPKSPSGARTFMDAFSEYTISEVFSMKLTDLELWDQNLARNATRLGIWRARPKDDSKRFMTSLGSPKTGFTSAQSSSGQKGRCAQRNVDGQWSCVDGHESDYCQLIGGEPSASSDLC